MQQMPSMEQLAGGQQQRQRGGMKITPQQVQQAQASQKPESQIALIVTKLRATLEEIGYFELPENKNRRAEIMEEINEIAQALLDNDIQTVENSEIYKYITAQKGQRKAMRNPAEQMEMPSMEGMTPNEANR